MGNFSFVSFHHDEQQRLDHRRQSTRLLHEFLLGEKIIQRTQDIYEREKTLE